MTPSPSRKLSAPLSNYLSEPETVAAERRIATRLFAPHGAHRQAASLAPSWLRFRPAVAAWGASAIAILCVCAWMLVRPGPSTLLLEDGRTFQELVGRGRSEHVQFTDGSSLTIDDTGRVVALASTAREMSLLLERGRLDVQVTPGGERRWTIETKIAQVEVVGTEFSVIRGPSSVEVSVRHGLVLVRSAELSEGVARLGDGDVLRVGDAVAARATVEPPRTEASPLAITAPAVDPIQVPAVATSKRELASFTALRDAADRARARGDASQAEQLYARLAKEHSTDPRLSTALFAWGVTSLQQSGGQPRAAKAFRSVLQSRPSRSLLEDTLLRLIELHLALGERESALRYQSEYQNRFPRGRHRATIDALLQRATGP
jgi:transmembrane sensor